VNRFTVAQKLFLQGSPVLFIDWFVSKESEQNFLSLY